jgi:hypothetical protein
MADQASTSERWGGFSQDPLPDEPPPRWFALLLALAVIVLMVLL